MDEGEGGRETSRGTLALREWVTRRGRKEREVRRRKLETCAGKEPPVQTGRTVWTDNQKESRIIGKLYVHKFSIFTQVKFSTHFLSCLSNIYVVFVTTIGHPPLRLDLLTHIGVCLLSVTRVRYRCRHTVDYSTQSYRVETDT